MAEIVVKHKGVIGGAAGEEESLQFIGGQPPSVQSRHGERMLYDLTSAKDQFVLGKIVSGELPTAYLLFDKRDTCGINVEILFLEFIMYDFFWVANSFHQF